MPVDATPLVEVVPVAGHAVQHTLTRVAENGSTLSFVIEAEAPVRLRVAPRQWAVRREHEYSVNTSFFRPFIVRAERDGELAFDLDRPRNCTVVVEPSPGTNLVVNGGFEVAGPNGLPAAWEPKSEHVPVQPPTQSRTRPIAPARTSSYCMCNTKPSTA